MSTPLAQSSWARTNPTRLAHRAPDVSKHLEIPPPLNLFETLRSEELSSPLRCAQAVPVALA
jgi:hypothetical protein